MERETLQAFFFPAYLKRALCFCPLWHCRHQADIPSLHIPTAACHNWFLRWQWWFVFTAQADPGIEAVKRVSAYPHKKKWHGFRSGDLGSQQCSAWSSAVSVQANVGAYAAPLAATNETHRLQHLQINLESFSFCMWVRAYGTARSLFVRRNTKKHTADCFMRWWS